MAAGWTATMACAKAIEGFELNIGPYKDEKVLVDGPEYETSGWIIKYGHLRSKFHSRV